MVAAGLLLTVAACGAPSASYDGAGGRASDHAAVPGDAFRATVDRVVDGDTIVARRDGRLWRVRLIGIDAPESVKPDAPVECFGPESARFLRDLLRGGTAVRAAYEDGGQRDQFGRELWDVWLPDGRLVQAVLVRAGTAEARLYRPQREYADLLAGLEEEARDAGTGLHSACPSG
ncbi:MAG: micrococcal nuclease [Actinomycetota bacterium]|nr:micrococcal nuclease [Actinomycetota bacterium]